MGWRNPHPHLLGEQFDQHHDPALPLCHLVHTFDAGKRAIGKAHTVLRVEQPRGLALHGGLLRLQLFNQPLVHLGRFRPKADQAVTPLVERMGAQLWAVTPSPRRMKR